MKSLLLCFSFCIYAFGLLAQDTDPEGFISLFNGKSLKGWSVTKENPKSFSAKGGSLICKGGRAHIFYSGKVGKADFKNFELKLKVKTIKGANSGVYFHTKYQKQGWPEVGFEAQVNSTHSDPRKTGSLYGIVNMWAPENKPDFMVQVKKNKEVFLAQDKAPSNDGEWFDYHIIVQGNTITIKVDGKTTVEWTQPEDWNKKRKIGHGTIGFQAHDPTCEVHYQDIRIKLLEE